MGATISRVFGDRSIEPEVHHVVKRAQGGSDFDLDRLMALCPPGMPEQMPPARGGRLVVTPLSGGHFTLAVGQGGNPGPLPAGGPRKSQVAIISHGTQGHDATAPPPREADPAGMIPSVLWRNHP